MKIDDLILLNQLAQGLIDICEGERWFIALGEREKRAVLQELNIMIANASPRSDDVPAAVLNSGLKSTYTPCVLIQRGEIRIQLGKIAALPENELLKSFRLLVALFNVCDGRRRAEKPLNTESHWWHRDLNDPKVVAAIRREFADHTGITGPANRPPTFRPRRVK